MQLENKLTEISNALNNSGKVLVPIDGFWSLCCKLSSAKAVSAIMNHPYQRYNPLHEIVFSDLLMLKSSLNKIHPRIETLLHYHERPIRIAFRNIKGLPDSFGNIPHIYCRIVKDKFSRRLLNTINAPLYIRTFTDESSKFPARYHHIISEAIPKPDYEVEHFYFEEMQEYGPLLSAHFDRDGMLTILE